MNEGKRSGTSDNESLLEDTPLHNPENDLLGRNNFSKALAQAILNMEAENGFVFALFGPWGSGKTTTLNFVLHHVNELSSESEKPIVVRFNPWWFSGQEQLLLRFFEQMRAALNKPNMPERLQKIGSKLQFYANALTPLVYLPISREFSEPVLALINSLGQTIGQVGETEQANVAGIRAEIDAALREQPRKVLIVIDDIDRLTAEEIRLMFRLIKAVADFPKTIYLLAFDREVVINALKEFQPTSGEGYLEKIVQAPFDLPLPDKVALRRLLFAQLDPLLEGTPDELFDQTEWNSIYLNSIDHFIRNPRDIKRLINILRASYSVVKGEVNFVDFVAIETLRVFVPKMYGIVRANPTLFTVSPTFIDPMAKEDRRKIFEQYLQEATSDVTRKPTHSLLLNLFPKYEAAFGSIPYDREWRRRLKVGSLVVFPVYFRLSFEEGAVTAAEMRSLISLAQDRYALSAELVRLTKERGPNSYTSRAREVLERLEDYISDGIPEEHATSLLQALYDAGDAFIEVKDHIYLIDIENDLRVLLITDRLLLRFPNQQRRFEILKNIVLNSESISMIAYQIVELGKEQGKYEASPKQDTEDKWIINSTQLKELEALFLQRIESAAQDGQLEGIPNLNYVLSLWEKLAGYEEPIQNFVTQLISSDIGLANLMKGFLSQTSSAGMTNRADQGRWMINILQVKKWADPHTLRDQVSSLLKDQPAWLTEKQKLALEVFLDTLEHAPKGYDAFGRPIKEKE